MKKYLPYIVGIAAIGGAAYLFVKNRKDNEEQPIEPTVEPKKVVTVQPAPVTADPWQNSVFVAAVRKIQEFLGVGIDGNPGKTAGTNTNKALAAKFPADFQRLSNLQPGNVKAWAELVQKAKSGQVLQKGAPDRKAFGEKLWKYGTEGKRIHLLKSTQSFPIVRFDAARNSYTSAGSNYAMINRGHLFAYFDRIGYDADGFYILRFKRNPKEFLIVNPYLFGAD